jgi:hypothetical protein
MSKSDWRWAMKALSIAAAVGIAASLAGFSQSTAGAARPQAILIQAYPSQFCCPEMGSWDVSGAITDSGSYVRTEAATAPPDRPPFTLGPLREVFVFSGALGTLTVREEARITASGVTGVWQIASGTGAYADASGHGTVAFSGPPFTLSLDGVISKAG